MKDITMNTEVELEIKVTGTAVPFVRGRQYMANGDPGYPDEGGYCEDITVYLTKEVKQNDGSVKEVKLDITDFVPDLEQLGCDLFEQHCEEERGAYEDAMEQRCEERGSSWDE